MPVAGSSTGRVLSFAACGSGGGVGSASGSAASPGGAASSITSSLSFAGDGMSDVEGESDVVVVAVVVSAVVPTAADETAGAPLGPTIRAPAAAV